MLEGNQGRREKYYLSPYDRGLREFTLNQKSASATIWI